jgi:hypothetical protein
MQGELVRCHDATRACPANSYAFSAYYSKTNT